MPFERKDFKRKSGLRDARLFVVATEGAETEPQYFKALVSEQWYRNTSVHLELLDGSDKGNAPLQVLKRLDIFAKNYHLKSDDELWLVIDRDFQSWTPQEIALVAQQCHKKRYHLALSNPCFELWLLLHVADPSEFTPQEKEAMLHNTKTSKKARTYLEKMLVEIVGQYNKTKLCTNDFLPFVELAIHRAKPLDTTPDARWIDSLGTRVYQLVEKLIEPKN